MDEALEHMTRAINGIQTQQKYSFKELDEIGKMTRKSGVEMEEGECESSVNYNQYNGSENTTVECERMER